MLTVDSNGEVVDAGALCDALMDEMEESGLDTPAALCACLAVIFNHIASEDGLDAVRDLFNQFEAQWRVNNAGGAPVFPPYEGVLQ